jgi:hypothetical protein
LNLGISPCLLLWWLRQLGSAHTFDIVFATARTFGLLAIALQMPYPALFTIREAISSAESFEFTGWGVYAYQASFSPPFIALLRVGDAKNDERGGVTR